MNRPSSRHLTHEYAAFKGLSLRELFWIAIVTTGLASLMFSLCGMFFGFALASGCIGFLLGFIFAITLLPKCIARLKAGKPHGYLLKKTWLVLARFHLRKSPYLSHQGFWQTSKLVRMRHV